MKETVSLSRAGEDRKSRKVSFHQNVIFDIDNKYKEWISLCMKIVVSFCLLGYSNSFEVIQTTIEISFYNFCLTVRRKYIFLNIQSSSLSCFFFFFSLHSHPVLRRKQNPNKQNPRDFNICKAHLNLCIWTSLPKFLIVLISVSW